MLYIRIIQETLKNGRYSSGEWGGKAGGRRDKRRGWEELEGRKGAVSKKQLESGGESG